MTTTFTESPPPKIIDEAERGRIFDHMRGRKNARPAYVALFRDRAMRDALIGADPEVKACFKASGFGLNAYDSGAPDGCFPAEDHGARLDVTERLTENLLKFDLKGKNFNGVCLKDFLAYEIDAKPIDMAASGKARAKSKTRRKLEAGRKVPTLNPLALLVLMVVIVPKLFSTIAPT